MTFLLRSSKVVFEFWFNTSFRKIWLHLLSFHVDDGVIWGYWYEFRAVLKWGLKLFCWGGLKVVIALLKNRISTLNSSYDFSLSFLWMWAFLHWSFHSLLLYIFFWRNLWFLYLIFLLIKIFLNCLWIHINTVRTSVININTSYLVVQWGNIAHIKNECWRNRWRYMLKYSDLIWFIFSQRLLVPYISLLIRAVHGIKNVEIHTFKTYFCKSSLSFAHRGIWFVIINLIDLQ